MQKGLVYLWFFIAKTSTFSHIQMDCGCPTGKSLNFVNLSGSRIFHILVSKPKILKQVIPLKDIRLMQPTTHKVNP
jgi:hypothetical protein